VSAAVAELLALEERRRAALSAGDAAALAELVSDDYVHCHSNGVAHDKAAMIAHMAANPRRVAERTPFVRVYGDVGLLTGEMVNIHPTTGERVRLFVTQAAHRFEDGWKFVSFHATRL
jgi:ketosteroid isomerase-like protein